MKRLKDYTNKELVALNEAEVETLIELECMCGNVAVPVQPQYKDLPKIPEEDLIIYGVGDYYFLDEAEAEQFCKTLNALGSRVSTDYRYDCGYKRQYCKPVDDCVSVTPKKVYSYDLYTRFNAIFKQRYEVEEYNSRLLKAYDEACEKVNETACQVRDAILTAQSAAYAMLNAKETYKKYKSLSDGDSEIAQSFFKETYSGYTEEEYEEIFAER